MNALLSNPFKEGLRKGEVQVGLWLSSTTSYMAEIAATSGYDWLLIDGEHAPNTVQDLYHQLQAIAPYASQPVVRPVEGSKALIKQVLDIGAQTAACPDGRQRRAGASGGFRDSLSTARRAWCRRQRGTGGALGAYRQLYGPG